MQEIPRSRSDCQAIIQCLFLAFRRNAQPSPREMIKGIWGFPNERKLALYYKDTARTVTDR